MLRIQDMLNISNSDNLVKKKNEDKKESPLYTRFSLEPTETEQPLFEMRLNLYDQYKIEAFIKVESLNKKAETVRACLVNWIYQLEALNVSQQTLLQKLNAYITAIERKDPNRRVIEQEFFQHAFNLKEEINNEEKLDELVYIRFRELAIYVVPKEKKAFEALLSGIAFLNVLQYKALQEQEFVDGKTDKLSQRILYLQTLLQKEGRGLKESISQEKKISAPEQSGEEFLKVLDTLPRKDAKGFQAELLARHITYAKGLFKKARPDLIKRSLLFNYLYSFFGDICPAAVSKTFVIEKEIINPTASPRNNLSALVTFLQGFKEHPDDLELVEPVRESRCCLRRR